MTDYLSDPIFGEDITTTEFRFGIQTYGLGVYGIGQGISVTVTAASAYLEDISASALAKTTPTPYMSDTGGTGALARTTPTPYMTDKP